MKTFVVVVRNKYNNIVVFNTKAVSRQVLYDSYHAPSKLLQERMLHDTILFAPYSREDIAKCIVECVEEDLVMI